jgi:mannose-6-phosphate isomerase-like protein (cupin superfamily)
MYTVLSRDELGRSGTTPLFEGGEYGGIPLSFFWLSTLPGRGPSLHLHPYAEAFVLQQGQATFTIGESTQELLGGQMVIVPANTPHKFKNSGTEPLQMITIHPSPQVITQWLEE